MNTLLSLVGGLGLGAGLMFLLDPDKGRRRRAMARDTMTRAAGRAESAISTTAHDVSNRAAGLLHDAQSFINREESGPVSDETLVARVRSKLGRVASHPRAITVTAEEGRVTLQGPVLASEVKGLLAGVRDVAGVTGVENLLEVHEFPDIAKLQGGTARTGERTELLQENWSPAMRLLGGIAGGTLAFYAARRRDMLGATLGTVALGLVARSLTNARIAEVSGINAIRQSAQDGSLKSMLDNVGSTLKSTVDKAGSALRSTMETVTGR